MNGSFKDIEAEDAIIRILNYLIYDKPLNGYDRPDYEVYAD
jgi:hypothetical protein